MNREVYKEFKKLRLSRTNGTGIPAMILPVIVCCLTIFGLGFPVPVLPARDSPDIYTQLERIEKQLGQYGYLDGPEGNVEETTLPGRAFGFSVAEKWLGLPSTPEKTEELDDRMFIPAEIAKAPEPDNDPGPTFLSKYLSILRTARDYFDRFLFPSSHDPTLPWNEVHLEAEYVHVDGQDTGFTTLDSGSNVTAALDLYFPAELSENLIIATDFEGMITNDYLYNDKQWRIDRWQEALLTKNFELRAGTIQPRLTEATLSRDLIGMSLDGGIGKFGFSGSYGTLTRPVEEVRFMTRTLGLGGTWALTPDLSVSARHVDSYDDEDSIEMTDGLFPGRNTILSIGSLFTPAGSGLTLSSEFLGSRTQTVMPDNEPVTEDFGYRFDGAYRRGKVMFRGEYERWGPDFETFAGFSSRDTKEWDLEMFYAMHPTFNIGASMRGTRDNVEMALPVTETVQEPRVMVTVQPIRRWFHLDLSHGWLTRKNTDLTVFQEETDTDVNMRFRLWDTDISTLYGILDERDHYDTTRTWSTHSIRTEVSRRFFGFLRAGLDLGVVQRRHVKIEQMDITRDGALDLRWDPGRDTRYTFSYRRSDIRRVETWYNQVKDSLGLDLRRRVDDSTGISLNFDSRHYQYKNQEVDYWDVILGISADIVF